LKHLQTEHGLPIINEEGKPIMFDRMALGVEEAS